MYVKIYNSTKYLESLYICASRTNRCVTTGAPTRQKEYVERTTPVKRNTQRRNNQSNDDTTNTDEEKFL